MAEEKKNHGFNGKILNVDLTAGAVVPVIEDESFYRTYLGGGLLGTYYVLRGTERGVDPLSPGNVLVFAPSVVTGSPVTGVSRFNVSSRSPLTGAIGDSQCGGGWGPELKNAGFDAVVIKGRSSKPVYLWIDNGSVEIRDASHMWGLSTGEAQKFIIEELGDSRIEIVQIGPAGENLVKYACITGGLSHFAGRTGMGAVMGSKNLKAIAVRGVRSYEFFDDDKVKQIAKKGSVSFKNSEPHQLFHKYGTGMGVEPNKDLGNIITKNFQSGHFEEAGEISGQKMTQEILSGTETCRACSVRCKRIVEMEKPYKIDPRYGGPEFETIVMLGSNLGIHDLSFIAKASEVCNKLGMDTITAGGMISFAMECFEKGIITEKETSGLQLRFGSKEVVLQLLELIAFRKGIGDVLAEGPQKAISILGEASGSLALHVKNQIIPGHMPRVKQSQALMYAVNPSGADHMSSEHDWIATNDGDVARGLGITDFTAYESLDKTKVRAIMFSQLYYSLLDSLTLCMFCWNPGSLFAYGDLEELVHAVTGWKVTFWELMKAGERRINLMRAFNEREGFNRSDDRLPERCFIPLPDGASAGKKVDRDSFEDRLTEYYAMMNWDTESGNPSKDKLEELGLGWVRDILTK